MVITHRCRGAAIPDIGDYASGWHTHCTILLALLENRTPPPFWATHERLVGEYAHRLPAKSPG